MQWCVAQKGLMNAWADSQQLRAAVIRQVVNARVVALTLATHVHLAELSEECHYAEQRQSKANDHCGWQQVLVIDQQASRRYGRQEQRTLQTAPAQLAGSAVTGRSRPRTSATSATPKTPPISAPETAPGHGHPC